MKRVIICISSILLFLLSCSTAPGVYITAKWHDGQDLNYVMKGTIIDINEAGDSTVTNGGSYYFNVKVLSSNDDGYKLRLEYPTVMYTETLHLELNDIGETIPIEFETDVDGVVTGVSNTEELIEISNKITDAMVKMPELSSMTEDELRKLFDSVMSPEVIIQSYSQDIEILLWAYGVPAIVGKEYTFESTSQIGEYEVPASCHVFLDSFKENDTHRVITMVTDFDKESILQYLSKFSTQIANAKGDIDAQEELKEFIDYVKESEMEIYSVNYCAFDTETTWPVMVTKKMSSTITDGEKKSTRIQLREYHLYQ